MERDLPINATSTRGGISIHALRMERDYPPNIGSIKEAINFNPRAPHGARPIPGTGGSAFIAFQSMRSAWSATGTARKWVWDARFQSTRSAWSATW